MDTPDTGSGPEGPTVDGPVAVTQEDVGPDRSDPTRHPYGPGPTGQAPYPPPYLLRRPTNNLAITAMIVGMVGIIACPLVGGVAVYLGNRARAEIRRSGEDGDGMAVAGVVTGWIGVGLSALTMLFVLAYVGFFALFLTSLPSAP
ncbi:hypothetical protein GCM10027290_22050 [Micromonospora sonneratiae]|uniref:DUF4190 domain-containing protein n=1 Tax=Micromonospora sonneratiae TaxID=1184706 RepID=A0ABW3YFN3_9ACTN